MQQLGFDIAYTDPNTKEMVPWALPVNSLLEEIKAAKWKIVDTETTGLNPSSLPQKFSAKELRTGVNSTLRMRVATVLYLDANKQKKVVSFDFDQLTAPEKQSVADAMYNNYVFAHNAGFDAFWMSMHTKNRPVKLLDSMLIARIMFPEQPIVMAKLATDDEADPRLKKVAELMFMGDKSGWALNDLVAGALGEYVPKEFQGPKNWCQPFLSQEAYNYATDDVEWVYKLLLKFFNLTSGENLIDVYESLAVTTHPSLRLVEPQVLDVVSMRQKGMPWCSTTANAYIVAQKEKIAKLVDDLIDFKPALARFKHQIADMNSGVSAELKDAIGKAFIEVGVNLNMTEKAGTYKIGEKDLRKVKAQVGSEDAAYLFTLWTSINKAKKSASMAVDFTGYAQRSADGRLHPNTMHGPVTGRLSSSEPNCQQMPRDQGFRNGVAARFGYSIAAVDYSALDMRVGAALAIRAQRQIAAAFNGEFEVNMEVKTAIRRVFTKSITFEKAVEMEERYSKEFQTLKDNRDNTEKKKYWDEYRRLSRIVLLSRFQRVLYTVRNHAEAEGTPEWGRLRNAFKIKGMDIHTWTALVMMGENPQEMFDGLSDEDVAIKLKESKKKLGDVRQTGKVGNLSLLYAMKSFGLQEAAAKNYNIHWTLEEADKVRVEWLAAYPEVDLWHLWTELNPHTTVWVPDSDRGGKVSKKDVYASVTLGNRLIYAFGLNAALSYDDQSTGADILGRVMSTFATQYPEIFECIINQVHDELVFEIPDEVVDEYTRTIEKVMTDCSEHFLMQFGVKGECSPAVGKVWLKD